ncbi:hypothetical protein [Pyxidicoccus trucidator]|uniref:hypothetical protein n=1 Tax=Pyxidicoccus trucidator TaxID=2709662 RepID=UPI0013DB533B|nr:hypothetical protein [Pyxidicoccus trucidator]
MSEPARARSSSPPASLLTPEDLRRKLEGRLELLEAMLPRYRWLEEALEDREWQGQLRARPEHVAEVLERDAACVEALERAARRAELEGWPEDSPVLETVHEARVRRERVEARVREALASLAPVSGTSSLEADLRRLAELVRDPVSFVRQPGESFSLLMGQTETLTRYSIGFLYPLGLMALLCVALAALVLEQPLVGLAAVVTGAGLLGMVGRFSRWMRPGSVWFTPERLVWVPPSGEPVAVSLGSIPEGGIRLEGSGLRVEGDRLVRLPRLGRKHAKRLRLWLELYRHPDTRARTALVEHATEAVCFPAMLRRDKKWQQGHAVLMRRMLFFLPGTDAGPALLRAATGRVLDSPVELAWVLDALRWQPESDLDAYLLRAVKATRGAAWPADLARRSRDLSTPYDVHITYQDEVVVGRVQGSQLPDTERILATWDGVPVPFPRPGGHA